MRAALNGISSSDDVVNAVALSVSQYFGRISLQKLRCGGDSIIDLSGGNVMELCKTLCKSSKTNIDMIEHLRGKCSYRGWRDVNAGFYRAFEDSIKQLGKSKNTGVFILWRCA